MQTSKKLIVLVDCDISNFMTNFKFFVSLYFWQNANEFSVSVQIKNMFSFNCISANLSGYIDFFLKYQAKTCKSYIRDTSGILLTLKSLSIAPSAFALVTMDVHSLNTHISITRRVLILATKSWKHAKKDCSIKHFEELHSINS